MNRIYLIRHGENRANITKEFSHKRVDYPLTEKGVLQAKQTAEHFGGLHVHEVYSSPLKRAKQTAEIIAEQLDLDVTVIENFREINVGSLEERPPTAENWALHDKIVEAWYSGRLEAKFPDGEDYLTLRSRLRAGFVEVVDHKTDRNIVVVGHGGLFTATVQELCQNVEVAQFRGHPLQNCSISEILLGRRDGHLEGKLIGWGFHDHLYGKAADLEPGRPQADT